MFIATTSLMDQTNLARYIVFKIKKNMTERKIGKRPSGQWFYYIQGDPSIINTDRKK